MKAAGVDIGGTFTDFLVLDEEHGRIELFKEPSTPADPSRAFIAGLARMADQGMDAAVLDQCIHGTTVATNTIIQRNGALTGLITTAGFRDVLEIGRSNRPSDRIYGLRWERPMPLVERFLRLGVRERTNRHGEIVEPLDEAQLLDALAFLDRHDVKSVAICFLFSYLNGHNERRAMELGACRFPHMAFSISSAILPQWREYERTNTTAADAFIKPVMDRYLGNLEQGLAEQGFRRDLLIMKSNGGVMRSSTARAYPIETFLSGPAAGVVAARHIGLQAGIQNLVEIDMGGTSLDVALVENGAYRYATDAEIEPTLPLKVAMIDIRTIGAGGGSIAWVDDGGALKVGPKSAGADPGPASYGRGGTEPTVTDANVVLGRIDPDHFLGGRFPLRADLAHEAVAHLAARLSLEPNALAQGILDITVARMAQEVRAAAVARGADLREFTLLAGGGAGPLHAPQIAREIGIRRVLIPRFPGLLSAIGLLLSDLRFDSVRTYPCVLEAVGTERVAEMLHEMIVAGIARIEAEGFETAPQIVASLDMRYERQNWDMNVIVDPDRLTLPDLARLFDAEHERLFGFAMPGERHELINLRCTVVGAIKDTASMLDRLVPAFPDRNGEPKGKRSVWDEHLGTMAEARVFERDQLARGQRIEGLAIIDEPDSTVLVPSDAVAEIDEFGNVLIEMGTV
jgi:N-methylhydantoinase A